MTTSQPTGGAEGASPSPSPDGTAAQPTAEGASASASEGAAEHAAPKGGRKQHTHTPKAAPAHAPSPPPAPAAPTLSVAGPAALIAKEPAPEVVVALEPAQATEVADRLATEPPINAQPIMVSGYVRARVKAPGATRGDGINVEGKPQHTWHQNDIGLFPAAILKAHPAVFEELKERKSPSLTEGAPTGHVWCGVAKGVGAVRVVGFDEGLKKRDHWVAGELGFFPEHIVKQQPSLFDIS